MAKLKRGALSIFGHRLEALGDIALALEAAGKQMDEDGARMAGNPDGCVNDAVSFIPVVRNGGDTLPDILPPPRSPSDTPVGGVSVAQCRDRLRQLLGVRLGLPERTAEPAPLGRDRNRSRGSSLYPLTAIGTDCSP